MTGYSTREVAEVLGLPASTILAWARSGLLSARRGPRGAYFFPFQDVALLRAARDLLDAEIPARRVRHALEALRARLPAGRPLSAVRLTALGGRVLVRDAGGVWDPDTGQLVLAFDGAAADADPAAAGGGTPAAGRGAGASADDWFEAGVGLEDAAPERARSAYAKALELDPAHAGAHLNLGRLLHEEGAVAEAEAHYRAAAASDPASARAFYNLGVALEDQGLGAGAVGAYETALRLDRDLAVAHFNLSRLYEASGRPAEALGHLASYKRILERGGPGD